MGMFDYIKCEMLIQGEDLSHIEFQTKDTPMQYCTEYVISKEGRLLEPETIPNPMTDEEKIAGYHQHVKSGIVKEPLEEYMKSPLIKLMGSQRQKLVGYKDLNHNGYIEFYWSNITGSSMRGFVTRDDEPFVDYNIVMLFTNGKGEVVSYKKTNTIDGRKHLTQKEFNAAFVEDRNSSIIIHPDLVKDLPKDV